MPRQIAVEELAAMLGRGEGITLLDVREPWEHETAALANSVLVPLPELEWRWAEVEAQSATLVVTYCHHGVRSLGAAALLESKGFASVASLAGGIDAWSARIDPKIPRY